ncbi:MAG: glycosyltransferase [Sphingomonadales bacterium]|nr:MAG: glycosyltransferase [Sphingomonadales bacterium]
MIDLVAWVVMAAPALVTLILAVELIAAQSRPRPPAATPGPAARITVLVPAHDEAAGIGETIADLRAGAPAGARLLVVADNCTDDTAAIGRAAGAEVVERNDTQNVGKGFALAFGRDHLASDPPDVVVIVDADCTVAGGGIARLAATALATRRPVQSTYLMRPRTDRGALVAMSNFAFLIRNLVRQRGLARLGAPALLTGAGMALPWGVMADAPLATGDLVEDLALGIELSRRGSPPAFLPDAETWSEAAGRSDTHAQRLRWEQGTLRAALREAPSLMRAGRWPLFWLGLHLLVPPLALLAAIDTVALGLLGSLACLGATALPLCLLSMLMIVMLAMLMLSWVRFGRAQITAVQLLIMPFYILWKVPIYALGLVRPERRWIRTGRD